MATAPATVADFKSQFDRGFKFGAGPGDVRDKDITLGITQAMMFWNECLWGTDEKKAAFLFAVAHFVVTTIQAAGGANPVQEGSPGALSPALGNRGSGITVSKSANGVSQTFAGLEKWVEKFPLLSDFLMTDYGRTYLHMLKPRLVGRIGIAANQQDIDTAVPLIPFVGP